jgi:RNA polymerase sigma factor (sigma-70 family)
MSLQELYTTYGKLVYNLSLQYVQNKEDAEEITQDVFVAIHQSIHNFKEQSKISTWIYRITINKSLDFIRSKNRKRRFAILTSLFFTDGSEAHKETSHFNHPGVLLEQKEKLQHLYNLINQLPPNQKTALILSKLDSKSQQEIAEIMNLSPKAVESLIQRAKVGLEKKLKLNEGKHL